MANPSKKVCRRFNSPRLVRIMTGLNDEAKSLLRELQIPRDLVDCSGKTLLHYALKYQNPEMLQHLIEIGHDIEVKDGDGFTVLKSAANNYDVRALAVLLKYNANIYCIQRNKMNFLQIAVRGRLVHCDYRLQEKSNSIFEIFMERTNKDFLNNNCKLTPQLSDLDDLVKLAIVAYSNVEFAKFILKNNYDIDYFVPDKRRTALHWAIIFGKKDNVKLLIEHGANANLLDDMRKSPLKYYTENFERTDEQSEVLKILINTRRDHAIVVSDSEHLLSVGTEKTVRVLLESGIGMVSMNFSSNTSLLHILMGNKNFDDLDFFAELIKKIDLNLPSNYGTPLMHAMRSGSLKKIDFLLQHGADVNWAKFDGSRTAIFHACTSWFEASSNNRKTWVKIVELLLQYGSDVQIILHDNLIIFDVMSNSKEYHNFHLQDFSKEYIRKSNQLPEMIIAHLAFLGSLDHVPLVDRIRNQIEVDRNMKSHFDLCTREIEELKGIRVYETITLSTLLAEKVDKIILYARNQQFSSAFNCAMEKVTHVQTYYLNTLQRKVAQATETIEAAAVVETLIGLCRDVYHIIVYKIIRCVDLQDLKNLREVRKYCFVE